MRGFFKPSLATASGAETDGELLERVRDGEHDAYGLLYERHYAAARRFARSIVWNDADADDVVAEAFAAVLSALERGKGPVGSFMPYLMNTVRHECYRVNRRSKRLAVDRYGNEESVAQGRDVRHDPFVGVDEAEVVRVALESLPANFRDVLWRTAVDDASPGEIAEGRGGTANAAAVTALRARRAFGSAYLQQHLTESDVGNVDETCRQVRPHLASFVRGTVGAGPRRRLEEHLDRCESCEDARRALGRMNTHLRSIPFLAFDLGGVGMASLGIKAQVLGWLSSSGAPLAACGAVVVAALGPPVSSVPAPRLIAETASFEAPQTATANWSSGVSIDIAYDVFPRSVRAAESSDVPTVLDPGSQQIADRDVAAAGSGVVETLAEPTAAGPLPATESQLETPRAEPPLRRGGTDPGRRLPSGTDVAAGTDSPDSDKSAEPYRDADTGDPHPDPPSGPHDDSPARNGDRRDGNENAGHGDVGNGDAGNVGNGNAGNVGNGDAGNVGNRNGVAVNLGDGHVIAGNGNANAGNAEMPAAPTPMPESDNTPMPTAPGESGIGNGDTDDGNAGVDTGTSAAANADRLTVVPMALPLSTNSNAEPSDVLATSGTAETAETHVPEDGVS